MPRHKMIDGVKVQFTAEEETARDAEEKAWADEAPNRKLKEIKKIRLQKLKETILSFNITYGLSVEIIASILSTVSTPTFSINKDNSEVSPYIRDPETISTFS